MLETALMYALRAPRSSFTPLMFPLLAIYETNMDQTSSPLLAPHPKPYTLLLSLDDCLGHLLGTYIETAAPSLDNVLLSTRCSLSFYYSHPSGTLSSYANSQGPKSCQFRKIYVTLKQENADPPTST